MTAGLRHLSNLFTPAAASTDATGVTIIAAAGDVGEARLVARLIRSWLPANVVVAVRDLAQREALLREVFDEYDVPAVFPVPMIQRCGALAFLRHAWRLPTTDFRFRDLTAVWRNSYFRPQFDDDLPLRAEALFRQLGVPKGKLHYLAELQRTAEDRLPLPLEDETMQRSERAARSQLAKRCLGFGQWFFGLYNAIPPSAPPAAMVEVLHRFATELGIDRGFANDDAAAWDAFWATLRNRAAGAKATSVTPVQFDRVIGDVMAKTVWPQAAGNGVRVLEAADAAGVPCTNLAIMGLGENSFPRFTGPATDEAMQAERAVFTTLVRSPTDAIGFSYAASDAKGQTLTPATFLRDVMALFVTPPIVSQSMLLDKYLTEPPVSTAEARTQAARKGVFSANLRPALRMAAARFNEGPNPYSGTLTNPKTIAAIADDFGPQKLFSPTSLETYIACPFRYWMDTVLRVEALEEPSEDVETHRRGTAIHRTMARLHAEPTQPEHIAADLEQQWARAVDEQTERMPSAAGQVLWGLERRRVQRQLKHYPKQWSSFRDGWKAQGITPQPSKLEIPFGFHGAEPLVIDVDGIQVRIGGIIDRVDLASIDGGLGFWIVDYKTGRGANYSAADVKDFHKLQLPLYAMAVERMTFEDGTARPLGMCFWIILENGAKHALPNAKQEFLWLSAEDEWMAHRWDLERIVVRMVTSLRGGDFRLSPRSEKTCEWCDYRTACRITQQRGRIESLELA